jgi:hypothetical protein
MKRLLLTLCAALLALTACGSEGTDPETDPVGTGPTESDPSESEASESEPGESDPSESMSTADPSTNLSITLSELEGSPGEESTYTLTCAPVGGDLPAGETACDNLAAPTVDPFAPVPPNQLCQDVIAGPGQITVTGTWDGETVDAQFSQRNSCEASRFHDISRILSLSPAE